MEEVNGAAKLLKKIGWKKEAKVCLGEIVGSLLVAFGTYNFAASLNVPLTGVSGVAFIMYRLFHVPMGWMTVLLNIPLIILCLRRMGKRFLMRSFRCMLIGSLLLDYFAPLFPAYHGERILAALCAGALTGLGYGIIYRVNSSTGGTDFLTVAVKSRWPHISMGFLEFMVAFVVLAVYALIFHDFDGIMYGLIISFVSSNVINRILVGANEGTVSLIVTDHPREICRCIDETIGRGSTVMQGKGGYQGDERSVVMCVMGQKEVAPLQEAVSELDPASFTVTMPCSEIHGEGFRYLTVGKIE